MCEPIAFKKKSFNNYSNVIRVPTLNMTHVSIKYQPFRLIKIIKVPELLLDMLL